MNSRVATAVALVVACSASACESNGCKKKTPEPTAKVEADAGAIDAAASDVPFALVAEGPSNVRADMTTDGRIVVIDGPMLYEAKPDGTLVSLVASTELAKLIPDADVLVGYSTTRSVQRISGALGGALLLDAFDDAYQPELFSYAAGKIGSLPSAVRAAVAYRGHPLVWDFEASKLAWADGADLPLPIAPEDAGIDIGRMHEGPKGTLVGIAAGREADRLVVWSPNEPVARQIPFPQDERTCDFISSFAERVVLVCSTKAYTVENDKLVATYTRTDPYPSKLSSQDVEGAMHTVSNERVARCPDKENGPCTTRDIPKHGLALAATYDLQNAGFAKSEEGPTWKTLSVDAFDKDPGYKSDVEQIFARGRNDVWLLRRDGTRTQILHTSAAPAKPKLLPTAADARVALRNERPPARWTGPCDQIYVRLGSDADAMVKRGDEIRAAVGLTNDAPHAYVDAFEWALVEGTLGDQRGVGVVLARRSPAEKIGALEKAVRELVRTFASGPANEPPVYCNLPVLEKKLLPK